MKKVVLLITAIVALGLASSGLGGNANYTPNWFDGAYQTQENVTSTITCTGPNPPYSHTTRTRFVLRVVNGTYGGQRIKMFGTLGSGSIDLATAAPGSPWLKLRESLRFTTTPSGSKWLIGSVAGGGAVPGTKCRAKEQGTIRGSHV